MTVTGRWQSRWNVNKNEIIAEMDNLYLLSKDWSEADSYKTGGVVHWQKEEEKKEKKKKKEKKENN